MVRKKALITGITGQDGAYLSRYLINKGYEVYGGIRRGSTDSNWRLEELGVLDQIKPIFLELLEESNINYIVKTLKVQEIYNLAAMSFVRTSFDYPVYTANVVGLGAMRFLEAIRQESPNTRFYQASSSEMFGKVTETPQNENTQFYPRSPYAIGKAFAHFSVLNYREAYGIHASSGILFNHESPLRGLEFVTRKITSTLARIANGENIILELGNMNAQRDWGYAGAYVKAMHLMLQQDEPDDYIISTGETHSIRDFLEIAANHLGMELNYAGSGVDEKIYDQDGKMIGRINPVHFRPTEVDLLLGDSTKAKKVLNWNPEFSFKELVIMMVESDFDKVNKGIKLQ